jgi:hypothetical protein
VGRSEIHAATLGQVTMLKLFSSLNVLEILRLGLTGLCFLLSFLAFWLIHLEQQRTGDPRRGILQAIYTFMGLNLLASGLVAASGYFLPPQQASAGTSALAVDTYLVDHTSYLVDLTQWTPATLGPVIVTRSDYVEKVSNKQEDYILPYFTTGKSIDWKPLTDSAEQKFFMKNDPGTSGVHYDYHLFIGKQPAGYSQMVSNQFTFPTGFKNPDHEWWQASAAYPSKVISVVIRFPQDKPCKEVEVSKIAGIKAKEPITDNVPVRTDGGHVVTWVGLNVEGNSRIQFDWDW